MKKYYLLQTLNLALLAGLVGTSTFVQASETAASAGAQEEQVNNARKRTPEQVVEALGNKLNLTEDQKSQLTPIISDRQQKLSVLKSDTSMRPRQKMRKTKSIFEDSDKKVNSLLNDQQKQQYKQIEQEMRQEMKERVQSRRTETN
jgi:periplasmic protein CpxP/Spy